MHVYVYVSCVYPYMCSCVGVLIGCMCVCPCKLANEPRVEQQKMDNAIKNVYDNFQKKSPISLKRELAKKCCRTFPCWSKNDTIVKNPVNGDFRQFMNFFR